MWYARLSMIKDAAGSLSELWKNLQSSGVAGRIGVGDSRQLADWLSHTNPEAMSSLREEFQNIPEEAVRRNIEKAHASYVSGKVLGEEIRRTREQALADGRPPSVAELRAARMRANQRINQQKLTGSAPSFNVGRRGPLGRPKLSPEPLPYITDKAVSDQASNILQKIVAQTRANATMQFRQPTAAEMREAINEANRQIQAAGLGEGIQFLISQRGPVGIPKLVGSHDRASAEYEERENRRKKHTNLGLDPILDIEKGNIPVPITEANPADNNIPEEGMVEQREQNDISKNIMRKKTQAAYTPQPKLHEHCRCVIIDLGNAYVWRTAGDQKVCKDCRLHSQEFNALGQQI